MQFFIIIFRINNFVHFYFWEIKIFVSGKTSRPSVELQKAAGQPRSFKLGSGLPPHRPEGERGEAEGELGLDGSRASPKKVEPEYEHSRYKQVTDFLV